MKPPPGLRELATVCGRLKFSPHRIQHLLDRSGRYEEKLTDEFPLLVRLFRFQADRFTQGNTWHERLELFLPLDGRCRLRMGPATVNLAPGDLLVVDNLKLHHTLNDPALDTRVVVVSFQPEFVYSLGSPSHDYTFLLPFYARVVSQPNVLRHADALAGPAAGALARLLACYFEGGDTATARAGCKAYLLELLYHLARHFTPHEVMRSEFLQHQERSLRLKRLFDHLAAHYGERISIAQAAALVHLSKPQFSRLFKRVAGMTFVHYVNHVRLAKAAERLRATRQTIAEIAADVGFSDQSYFDRLFKRAFGQSPRDFREAATTDRPLGPVRPAES
jgi:AraC-like DNA-binding protein